MSSDLPAKGPRRRIRIGKYEVLAHVATGGMGAVYKARDSETNREVALKVLSPEMAAKPAMLERFRREARHAAKLRHENIVTLYEFGEANRTFYLAMEFIDGIDLHEYSNRNGPLDPDEALQIIVQGCKALEHAYLCGVIHRDIKPSNFLILQSGERMVVKLTDLGLAREVSNDEFRVTRAGTTVGTLDYMAPEQARDSGLADIRSDLYSLGSTWYHLLAGHAPFPKGGLGERLNRIMNEEPKDIRSLNPRVTEATAAVLSRLLAKKPAHRYQKPAELLRDLESLTRGETPVPSRELLANLALDEGEAIEPPSRALKSVKKGPRSNAGRKTPRPSPSRPDTKAAKSTAEEETRGIEPARPYVWYGLAGATAIILIVGLTVMLSLRRSHKEDPITADTTPYNPSPIIPRDVPSVPTPQPISNPNVGVPVVVPPKKPVWPALYQPKKAIDLDALRKEIAAPWAVVPASSPTVELIVGRLPGVPGKTFHSLADACKAIPAGATGIIELRDNGPFFDLPAALVDRSLVVRPAKGYRPLLVWDVQRTLDERRRNRDRKQPADESPLVFLNVKHGNLTLKDVHVALQWPDAPSAGSALLRVEDGDLTVSGCVFSFAGKPRDGVTLASFAATRPEAGRCRFSRCYACGESLSVLDLNAPGSQTLFDDCLLVGGDAPLVKVRAAADRPTNVWAARLTMICGKSLLTVSPSKVGESDPAFSWLGWDVLLSRKTKEVGGELLRLDDGVRPEKMSWQAINCLYAGWETLLAAKPSISARDLAAWQKQWKRSEGEGVSVEPWPTAVFPEPAEVQASTYRTADSAVAFAASSGTDRLLGCDPDGLPPVADNWLSLTFGRFAVLPPPLPDSDDPPEILAPGDGLYHGERLDLNLIDLGAHLETVRKTRKFAPRVVLHLAGSGDRFTTPIRIKGSSLVLYFEPPPNKPAARAEKADPLSLAPAGQAAADALIEVEQGNLDIINGRLRLADAADARVVPWLIKVRGGDVRLYRSRLEVPPKNRGSAFRGLISLDGSGDAAERVRSCAVNETILVSARDGLAVQGVGARVLLTQTLLVAGGAALRLTLDPGFTGKANVQCLLDRATVAAQGSVVHVADVARAGAPTEPIVVWTHDCAFLNPFVRRGFSRAGLMLYEGETLSRGLLVWQSDRDAFDRRLWFGAAPAGAPLPDKIEDHASWVALWGTPALNHVVLDLNVFRTLDAERWPLERLAGAKIPGANLEKLGITKIPVKKPPQ